MPHPPASSASRSAATAPDEVETGPDPDRMEPSGSEVELAHFRRVGIVDVFSWNPARSQRAGARPRLVDNFGDLLGPYLVARLTPPRPAYPTDLTNSSRVLYSVGSILHLTDRPGVVWGAGINFKVPRPLPPRPGSLDVRAVRGPLTARTLAALGVRVPQVFGDPALLLPLVHPELATWSRRKRHPVLVAPNLNDEPALGAEAARLGLPVLSPRTHLDHALRMIAESECVVGTSLHAIAVADSLEVPARLVASDAEHPFKYRDYLAGSGRPRTRIAADLHEALQLGGHEPADADLEQLLDSFPRDLWDAGSPNPAARSFSISPAAGRRWAELVRRSPITPAPLVRPFCETTLPDLFARADELAARTALGPLDPDDPAAESFRAAFDTAADLYASLLLDLGSDDEIDPQVADCLVSGQPASLVILRWLRRTGPHAVLRFCRATPHALVATVALRPGSLSNSIRSAVVRLTSTDGATVEVTPPIFGMHAGQWSVELTVARAGEDLQGRRWRAEVVVDGEWSVPVRLADTDSDQAQRWGVPSATDWVLDLTAAEPPEP